MYFSFLFSSIFGKDFSMSYPSKSPKHVLSLPFSDGKFGAYMQVHIQNDGPVTIELESPAATVDPKQVSKPGGQSGKGGCIGCASSANLLPVTVRWRPVVSWSLGKNW